MVLCLIHSASQRQYTVCVYGRNGASLASESAETKREIEKEETRRHMQSYILLLSCKTDTREALDCHGRRCVDVRHNGTTACTQRALSVMPARVSVVLAPVVSTRIHAHIRCLYCDTQQLSTRAPLHSNRSSVVTVRTLSSTRNSTNAKQLFKCSKTG